MPQRIEAVIFDLDGLMMDSEPLSMQAWQRVLSERGIELGLDDYKQTIGLDSHASSMLFKRQFGLDDEVDDLIQLSEGLRLKIIGEGVRPVDGLVDLLDDLKGRGVKMGAASNSPRDYVELALEKLSVPSYFACVVSVDDVENGKPDPDPYLATAQCLSVRPEGCLAIEDSPSGMKSALRAGMRCVVIPSPEFEADDFAGAHSRYESLLQLAENIQSELGSSIEFGNG